MSDLSGAESAPVNDAPESSGTEGATEAPAVDYSRMEQRMAEMLEEQSRKLEERFRPPEPDEPDDEYEDFPLDEGDEGWEEQEAQRIVRQLAQDEARKMLEPIQKQQQLERRDEEFDALLEEYPALQDEKFAGGIIATARDLVEGNKAFMESPRFVDLIETVYKAHVADERAKQEKPAGERREVVLEGGGGRAPAEPEEDLQDRVLAASKRFQGI